MLSLTCWINIVGTPLQIFHSIALCRQNALRVCPDLDIMCLKLLRRFCFPSSCSNLDKYNLLLVWNSMFLEYRRATGTSTTSLGSMGAINLMKRRRIRLYQCYIMCRGRENVTWRDAHVNTWYRMRTIVAVRIRIAFCFGIYVGVSYLVWTRG